jgi:hypothetical protein
MKTENTGSRENKPRMNINGITITIPAELGLQAGAPFENRQEMESGQISKDVMELLAPLADMATHAWRLKIRMVDADGAPKEENSKLFRYVEGLFRALNDAGVDIIDKTGKKYDLGMPEKVINFEEVPGLQREEIIETIRPAIRWKNKFLFMGEIIVGVPVVKDKEPVETEKEVIAVKSLVEEKDRSGGQSEQKNEPEATKQPEKKTKKKGKKPGKQK